MSVRPEEPECHEREHVRLGREDLVERLVLNHLHLLGVEGLEGVGFMVYGLMFGV
jgi:hypothetical protein